jgi:O-antigen/teichoic acid export membrane protein
MIKRLKSMSKNVAVTGTIIVTLGSFIASGFSYLLQFALGRLLTVPDYGTYNALLSVTNIAGVPAMVLITSLVKLTSELKAKDSFDKLTHIFWKFSAIMVALGFVVFALLSLLKEPLARYMNITESYLFMYLGLVIGISFLMSVPYAYLQGLLRFKAFAFSKMMGGFLRLVIPVSVVLLGYGLGGVFMGIAVAALITYTIGILLLKKNFRKYGNDDLSPYYRKVMTFGVSVLFVNLGLMLMNNLDLILVKKYFSEDIAGFYAGTVTVSKVLLFGAGTVAIVMFPQISELYAKGENYVKRLKIFFTLQLVLVTGGILFFTLFAELITRIMFGEKFMPSVEYIPLFTVFIGLYVLINFMILFFLAIGKTKVFLLQIPAVILQFILITLFHNNLYEVIKINIFVALLLLVGILFYYWKYVGFKYHAAREV